jgi:hypothetical protein
MEPIDFKNSLTRSDNGSIQNPNKNPITLATGSIVKLEESVKTYLHAESMKSCVINSEHEAWSEYERLNG